MLACARAHEVISTLNSSSAGAFQQGAPIYVAPPFGATLLLVDTRPPVSLTIGADKDSSIPSQLHEPPPPPSPTPSASVFFLCDALSDPARHKRRCLQLPPTPSSFSAATARVARPPCSSAHALHFTLSLGIGCFGRAPRPVWVRA